MMNTTLNIAGCQHMANNILQYLSQLLQYAMANDYGKSKEFAAKIVYDGNNLLQFIPEELSPKWLVDAIIKCEEYKTLGNVNAGEYAKKAIVINDIFFELKNFKWESLEIMSEGRIDLDNEFSQCTRAAHLDQAIDRLIDCLRIMANDPAFHLDKKTKVDIESLIRNLHGSKYASESAIRSWVITAAELAKLFVPHMDKIEKSIELVKKTEAAINEVYFIMDNARYQVQQRLIDEFCHGKKLFLDSPQTPNILLLPEPEQNDLEK